MTPLTLDAEHGEGGGQVLRTALALAVALGRPVVLRDIRRRRPRPGLQPQHLTVVRALAAIADADVTGDALGSTALAFTPRSLRAGDWRFDIGAIKGSAGSVSLLCQSLLLPLARADAPSRLTLVGGTHVPWSPIVHYPTAVFLPALAPLGLTARVELRRWGWYPSGGGEIDAHVAPARRVAGLTATRPPAPLDIAGISAVSRLPRSIAERQRRQAEARLQAAGLRADTCTWPTSSCRSSRWPTARRPSRAPGCPATCRRSPGSCSSSWRSTSRWPTNDPPGSRSCPRPPARDTSRPGPDAPPGALAPRVRARGVGGPRRKCATPLATAGGGGHGHHPCMPWHGLATRRSSADRSPARPRPRRGGT